jgi:hypothetical protein
MNRRSLAGRCGLREQPHGWNHSDVPATGASHSGPEQSEQAPSVCDGESRRLQNGIAHGDNSGYQVMGNQMGVNPNVAKIIFQKGVDSAEWQNVAKAKGWTNDKFASLLGALQSIQMSETLSALDASHSAHPGFSPAKAYADFLQSPEVSNQIDKAVNGYGRSSFGSFLVSGAAGGGYRDNWTAYSQAIANQYFLNNGRNLQQRINQQRSMAGDPFTRFNAINRAAGLTPQESQLLLTNVKPLVSSAKSTIRLCRTSRIRLAQPTIITLAISIRSRVS